MSRFNKKGVFFDFYVDEISETADLYMMGDITSYRWSEDDVDFNTFKDALDSIKDNGILNIYQNCGGGECFLASAIISLLDRCKKKRNITTNCYVDSLTASASGWITCACDNIYINTNSILMLHKPLSCVWGNADDMEKEIELLNKIQDEVMIPTYLRKAKDGITEDTIKELINKETWLFGHEIEDYFDVNFIENNNERVASINMEYLKNYNVPERARNILEKQSQQKKSLEIKKENELIEKLNKEIDIALAVC